MDVLLSLSNYEAILLHTHASVSFDSCSAMARYFERGNIPAFARSFYEEAASWRDIGQRIEAQMKSDDIERHDWDA